MPSKKLDLAVVDNERICFIVSTEDPQNSGAGNTRSSYPLTTEREEHMEPQRSQRGKAGTKESA
jgi:hypothetical protein